MKFPQEIQLLVLEDSSIIESISFPLFLLVEIQTLYYDLTFHLGSNFYCTQHHIKSTCVTVQSSFLLFVYIPYVLFSLSISSLLLDNEAPSKTLYKLSVNSEKYIRTFL